mgnify:CR=1 FL=1
MVVGLGIDLTEIRRIDQMLVRWGKRFTQRVFTDSERAYCEGRANPAQHFAARFAAKEATLKALSVPRGLRWHEMEVQGGGSEPPILRLRGKALAEASALSATNFHLSLSHTDEIATAVVIVESI